MDVERADDGGAHTNAALSEDTRAGNTVLPRGQSSPLRPCQERHHSVGKLREGCRRLSCVQQPLPTAWRASREQLGREQPVPILRAPDYERGGPLPAALGHA